MSGASGTLSSHSTSTIAAPCAGRTVARVVAIRAYAGGEYPERKSPRKFQRGFKGASGTPSREPGVRTHGLRTRSFYGRTYLCRALPLKGSAVPEVKETPLEHVCRGCGKTIRTGRSHCGRCAVESATQRLGDAARLGREAAREPEARAKHSATRKRHAQACSAWDPSSQPAWLTAKLYSEKIQPLLAQASASAIANRIGVSRWYAGRIREGYRPHPRHWQALADLVGAAGSSP
jgi:hypothetical protein